MHLKRTDGQSHSACSGRGGIMIEGKVGGGEDEEDELELESMCA